MSLDCFEVFTEASSAQTRWDRRRSFSISGGDFLRRDVERERFGPGQSGRFARRGSEERRSRAPPLSSSHVLWRPKLESLGLGLQPEASGLLLP